ncbi:TPA: putative bifunctional diguanylate cyclase/phosphodiesterase [Clostridioides difficile]|uniref:putative bifunctional diguanylate cyclase/phosphodiesterase n=1 Tax=Clostridioides difficile TaxID=1496 RepID=UPI00038D3A32|nr:bifunctional diguanylate cyclase/phosphodiesterase [Clostridioides difficile]AXU53922.1 signaling protein [Clostridioides difficile]EGT3737270.1 bifunctional diguanylate cyclase/phosphodiesterase [Clostridioides difficile]EGT3790363.1 bifunctional diguanylate cyclase/phosphodiesterase [Clostridioides difficile]EGT4736142.1 bifunctional diguanylate cyclase/phosphodiesterase [Clostridioides difficile]EGT4844494.1 bifunctional diguanylate cyclase/phosphodiesterase [Clostridioides difficile]
MKKKYDFLIYSAIWLVIIILFIFSLYHSIEHIKIISHTGTIRSETQKVVKQELNNERNDDLIKRLDNILIKLRTGNGENGFQRCDNKEFQQKLNQMDSMWESMKKEIIKVRNGASVDKLYKLSEEYSVLSNQIVFISEKHSNAKLYSFATALFIYLIFSTISLLIWEYYNKKRFKRIFYTDNLTKIKNQVAFENRAIEILHNASNKEYVLLNIDIDNFKYINDTHGYEYGDKVLIIVAAALSKTFNIKETCARIGSDNFVILAKYRDSLLEDIREMLTNAIISELDMNVTQTISYCIGAYLVEIDNLGYKSINSMMDKANIAHKVSKTRGISSTVWYNENLLKQLQMENSIYNYMYKAIENEEFHMYLQPKFQISSLNVVSAEALVRWFSPELGFLSPDEFIPLFEKSGFIIELDFYMLKKACSFVKKTFMKKNQYTYPIAVNFSRVTIYQNSFYQRFLDTVKEYEIPFKYIEIEVTESAFNEISQPVISILEELKKLGFLISMDDFGSGYSSLSLLCSLSINGLKLDKSLLKETFNREKVYSIIQCIIEMSHRIGMSVVCEGIETKKDLEFLNTVKCDVGQGFYFSKPIEEKEFFNKYVTKK